MATLVTPLAALQVVNDAEQTYARKITQLSTAGGKFSVRANAVGPVGSHPVHIDLTSEEEIDDFWDWYESILGACEPFWLPTYQRDFVPLLTIGAADTTFDIQDRGYTDFEFVDTLRQQIAFVFGDGTIIKRQITAAESNGDGTETITINTELGQEFVQRRNTGICYLLYGRLSEDTIKMDWWQYNIAEVDFTFVELREEIPEGSVL